ncbi:MAG: acyl-CoA dehydrogenase family protein [Phycisphaerales bacterium JB058]
MARLAAEIMGQEMAAAPPADDRAGGDPHAIWRKRYYWALANSIAGGATNIQRNIIAERCGDAALPLPLAGPLLSTVALVEHGDPEQQTRWLPGLIDGSVLGSVGFVTGAVREENEQIQCSWVLFAKHADLLVLVDAGRVLLAADAWGIACRMLETTRQYAISRKQFARAIGEFQSVKHPIADMAVVHEFSRALVWDAANAWDGRSEAVTEAAMLCKAHITAHAVEVSRRCIELMGATGFIWEEDHHLWLKRAHLDSALLGSPMELRSLLARSRGWDRTPAPVGPLSQKPDLESGGRPNG